MEDFGRAINYSVTFCFIAVSVLYDDCGDVDNDEMLVVKVIYALPSFRLYLTIQALGVATEFSDYYASVVFLQRALICRHTKNTAAVIFRQRYSFVCFRCKNQLSLSCIHLP